MRSEFSALLSFLAPLADFSRVVASYIWARRGACVSAAAFFALALLCGAVGPVFGALLALALAVAAPLCVAVASLLDSVPSDAWRFSYLDRDLSDDSRASEAAAVAVASPFSRGAAVIVCAAVALVAAGAVPAGVAVALAVVGCCYLAFAFDAVRV